MSARRAAALSDWRPTGRKGQSVAVRPSFHVRPPAAVLDSAFEALRAVPAPLFILSALGNLPIAAVLAGLILWVRDRGYTWGSSSYFVGVGALSAGLAVAAWLRALATGAMSYASLAALSGGGVSLAEAAGQALRSGSALALGAALRMVAILGGALACLLPAALAYFALALLPTAIVAERLAVSEALVRSSRLLPHALGGNFMALLTGLIGYPVLFVQLLLSLRIAEQVAGSALPLPGTLLVPGTALALLVLAKILLDPLLSAISAATWVDARIRAEGLDLELRRQLLAGDRLAVDPGRGEA